VLAELPGFSMMQTWGEAPGLKAFNYIVVGDCTTLQGLAAPYDEEDTTQIENRACACSFYT
jgi:hypothetical protein